MMKGDDGTNMPSSWLPRSKSEQGQKRRGQDYMQHRRSQDAYPGRHTQQCVPPILCVSAKPIKLTQSTLTIEDFFTLLQLM